VLIFPGFFREKFVRFIENDQVRSGSPRRSTKKEKTRVEKSDDNVGNDDGINGPPPFVMPPPEPQAPADESHIVTPVSLASDIENPNANRDRIESVELD
jgi:hypothetical protein